MSWPSWVKDMFAVFNAASSAGESVLAYECVSDALRGGSRRGGLDGEVNPFYFAGLILLTLPVLSAGFAGVYWFGRSCRSKRAGNKGGSDGDSITMHTNPTLSVHVNSGGGNGGYQDDGEGYSSARNGFIVTMLVLSFLLHPTLTKTAFKFFTCKSPSCVLLVAARLMATNAWRSR